METKTENVMPHEEVMEILGVEPKDLTGDIKKLFNYLRMIKNRKDVTDERKITLSSQLSGALIIQFAESPEDAEKAKAAAEAAAEAATEAAATEAAATEAAATEAAAAKKAENTTETKDDKKRNGNDALLQWEKIILQNAPNGHISVAKLKELGFIAKDQDKAADTIMLVNKKLKYDSFIDSYKISNKDSGSGFLIPALMIGAAGLFAVLGLRKK